MPIKWNSRAGRAVAKALKIHTPPETGPEGAAADEVVAWCERNDQPPPVRHHVALLPRKFEFDLAWPAFQVAVEFDGGVYGYGRHVRPSGFERDHEKRAIAQNRGWIVLCCTYRQLKRGDLFRWLEEALHVRGG